MADTIRSQSSSIDIDFSKILRALEQRTVRPVGADKEISFDARVVSATHRDLSARIADKTFREDLYYRLNVLEIRLPPLRSRGTDVLLLAQELLERIAKRTGRSVTGFDETCARCLVDYAWPGNVRELANVMERAVALARSETLGVADLPDKVARADRAHVLAASRDPDELVTLEEMERRYVLEVLGACGGHRARAAEVLGIDRKTLYARLKQYGVSGSEPAGT
jgi:two-component system response regulator HydG